MNALLNLKISKNWGEGKVSCVDAHLARFKYKVLQWSYNRKFGSYVLEFYIFVADNYALYHRTLVEFVYNESVYTLNEIYCNESNLVLKKHYTDTKVAMIINFVLFVFVCVKYNFKIKGIQNHKIYKVDKDKDYSSLSESLKHRDFLIKMDNIVNQWYIMAYFYDLILYEYSTSLVLLKKLLILNIKNEFYKASLFL